MVIDWPTISMFDLTIGMTFGNVGKGTSKTFPIHGEGVFEPWYPSLLLLASTVTGHAAVVSIPPNSIQPRIAWTTPGLPLSIVQGTPNSINIFKTGTDLTFEFNVAVQGLIATRLI
jgi:hypothetical protein